MPTEEKLVHPGRSGRRRQVALREIPKRPLNPRSLRAPQLSAVAGTPRPKRKLTVAEAAGEERRDPDSPLLSGAGGDPGGGGG